VYGRLFGDLRVVVVDQVAQGDRVASRWEAHGTYRGQPVTLGGITISRLDGGRIVEDWSVTDTWELLRQLGAWRGLAAAISLLRGLVRRGR
jgi:predicted ester cyclase